MTSLDDWFEEGLQKGKQDKISERFVDMLKKEKYDRYRIILKNLYFSETKSIIRNFQLEFKKSSIQSYIKKNSIMKLIRFRLSMQWNYCNLWDGESNPTIDNIGVTDFIVYHRIREELLLHLLIGL